MSQPNTQCDCVCLGFPSQMDLRWDVIVGTQKNEHGTFAKIARRDCEHCRGTGLVAGRVRPAEVDR
jgi:hypothetical protein